MPRKKRSQRQAIEFASYHVRITGWDWDYSFSVNGAKWEDKQFADYRYLTVRGILLRPRRIKVEAAELTFIPEAGLAELEQSNDASARAVGSLNIQDTRLLGYLSMPTDALGPVLQMLIANRFKYVLLNGEVMRYRKALVHRYNLTERHDEADYPDDE